METQFTILIRKGERTLPSQKKKTLLPTFEILFENKYVIRGELYPGLAPNTVGAFIHLANSGFYDGAVTIDGNKNALLQIDHLEKKAPFCVDGEMPLNDCTYNTGKLSYGGLCMFHPNGCYSTRSHFMIVLQNTPRSINMLSADYTFFGQALEGLQFARLLSCYCWDKYNQRPIYHKIQSIRVDTHGVEYPFQTVPVPDRYP